MMQEKGDREKKDKSECNGNGVNMYNSMVAVLSLSTQYWRLVQEIYKNKLNGNQYCIRIAIGKGPPLLRLLPGLVPSWRVFLLLQGHKDFFSYCKVTNIFSLIARSQSFFLLSPGLRNVFYCQVQFHNFFSEFHTCGKWRNRGSRTYFLMCK